MSKEYGKITVGYGSSDQKELQISDFIQAEFKDHRLITISQIEDGSFVASVENPKSTGRNTQSTIWLSKESLIGVISAALLYFELKGEDIKTEVESICSFNDVQISYSDNLELTELEKQD